MRSEIWKASFKPRVPNYTQSVPGQPRKIMISGPTQISDCYYTDHRSVTTGPNVVSRRRSRVEISITSYHFFSVT